MPEIHIQRAHQLGLKQARKIAFSWAEKAEEKLDMECVYEEGDDEDLLTFTRSGVKGTLRVDAQQMELKAQLGFLFAAFKDRIESEISGQLDALLNAPASAKKAAAAADKKKPAEKTPEKTAAKDKAPAAPKAVTAKPASRAKKI